MQRMLQQLGVNANLGPFNIVVRNAAFSFANQVSGAVLPDLRTMPPLPVFLNQVCRVAFRACANAKQQRCTGILGPASCGWDSLHA